MDLVLQLVSGTISLMFMLVKFAFQLTFIAIRGLLQLLGARQSEV